DRMLAADLLHRSVATEAGQHDLDLLLCRPTPVLALHAQPSLLVGRAAHAEPTAGQSLRRYAPPGLPGGPSQLPVNAGPGSGAADQRARSPFRGRVELLHPLRAEQNCAPNIECCGRDAGIRGLCVAAWAPRTPAGWDPSLAGG